MAYFSIFVFLAPPFDERKRRVSICKKSLWTAIGVIVLAVSFAALWLRERRIVMEKIMFTEENKSKRTKIDMMGKFIRFLHLTLRGKTG
jgi:hypothetical protein